MVLRSLAVRSFSQAITALSPVGVVTFSFGIL